MMVERRPAAGTHLRATGIRIRTRDLIRNWGLADEIRRQALPNVGTGEFAWTHTLVGEELGRLSDRRGRGRSHLSAGHQPDDVLDDISATKQFPREETGR